jgi:hypothetical protein
MHAFDFAVPFYVLMLMTAVVNLFTTIPSAPGHVGTFHAPGIEILRQFGVPQALATGYTVVLHIALWLPITALGGFYMLRESISWSEAETAARHAEAEAAARGQAVAADPEQAESALRNAASSESEHERTQDSEQQEQEPTGAAL